MRTDVGSSPDCVKIKNPDALAATRLLEWQYDRPASRRLAWR
jgi:hypothetical protein